MRKIIRGCRKSVVLIPLQLKQQQNTLEDRKAFKEPLVESKENVFKEIIWDSEAD